tara:strand:+ start:4130 stop:4345 length:216 start_codon:yes stop_codon:yes gene_type:complete
MLNFCKTIDSHEFSETIRKVNNLATGANELVKSFQQLILIIRTLNRTAAPIDCRMLLKLVISNLQPKIFYC